MTTTAQSPVVNPEKWAKLEKLVTEYRAEWKLPEQITLDDYKQAVLKLVDLANLDCGSSRAAAQVLLNLYNGHNYHCNLIDLTLLDRDHYCAAITAIRGRVQTNTEPHEIIPAGDRVFHLLQQDWADYRNHIRHLPTL